MKPALVFEPLDVLATPFGGTVAIEASAGTGKTHTLTQLYLRLVLEAGFDVREILVVTYTKAATAELRDRIRGRLASARKAFETGVVEPGDDVAAALLTRLPDHRARVATLAQALGGFDEAAIFTIHGFCQRVLAERAFETGTAFDVELAPDQQDLVRGVVDDFWRRELYEASASFVSYALGAGITPDELVLLVRSHAARPYRLIDAPEVPADLAEREAAFERAVADARELWAEHGTAAVECIRAARALRAGYRDAWLDKWHAVVGLYLGAERCSPNVPEQVGRFSQRVITKAAKDGRAPIHPVFDACERVVATGGRLHAAYEACLGALRARLVGFATEELARRKAVERVQHYDDLLTALARALADGERGRELAALVRGRYRAALIDEFQDTDPVQYEIFRDVYAGSGAPVFLVGDPKQAIYGFRGADVFTYLRARAAADGRRRLERNWRSEKALVTAVNAVFGGAPAPFVLDEIPYVPTEPGPRARPALEIDGEAGPGMRLWLLDGDRIQKGQAREIAAEAAAAEVGRLIALGASGRARLGTEALHGGHMAILVRTNDEGRLVRERLRVHGVPAVQQAIDSVLASREAGELERVLLAVAEPAQAALVRGALATEMLGVDAATLAGFATNERAWEARVEAFHDYHRLWRDKGGFARMLRELLWHEGVPARLLAHEDGERRLTNLLHVAELLQDHWARERVGMDALIDWLADARRAAAREDEEQQLRLESDERLVQIVTVHKSKGLEYPIVLCPFLWDGRLYARDAKGVVAHDDADDARAALDFGSPRFAERQVQAVREELAEKLRLLYVALTRAVHRTYVVWGHIRDGGTAPLAWLLHAPADSAAAADPAAAVAARYDKLSADALRADLARLVERAGGAITLGIAPSGGKRVESRVAADARVGAARVLGRQLREPWRVTSYTDLVRGLDAERPDHDAGHDVPVPVEPVRRDLVGFPRGARAGNCVHTVFEHVDFTAPATFAPSVRSALAQHGLDAAWAPVLAEMVERVVATPLDESGTVRLGRVGRNDRLVELEFHRPLARLDAARLRRLLVKHRFGAGPIASAVARLSLTPVRGFLKGFIDLVFECDGRFWLVDYKSNWLGRTPEAYAADALPAVIARDGYWLQYLLYTVVVHRFLARRMAGYDYDRHLGGVRYLFVRGMDPERGAGFGVYQDRPSRALIEALDRELGEAEA
jgi:exodeoxyribonuclease V beta subunit